MRVRVIDGTFRRDSNISQTSAATARRSVPRTENLSKHLIETDSLNICFKSAILLLFSWESILFLSCLCCCAGWKRWSLVRLRFAIELISHTRTPSIPLSDNLLTNERKTLIRRHHQSSPCADVTAPKAAENMKNRSGWAIELLGGADARAGGWRGSCSVGRICDLSLRVMLIWLMLVDRCNVIPAIQVLGACVSGACATRRQIAFVASKFEKSFHRSTFTSIPAYMYVPYTIGKFRHVFYSSRLNS